MKSSHKHQLKYFNNSISLAVVITLSLIGCNNTETNNMAEIAPPIAEKKDSVLTAHGDTRIDPYFWMRLTDEQKNAKNPDPQTQQVVDYLNAENDYTAQILKPTDSIQEVLYDEIVGRIKQTDESLPYFTNGYWYYTRYEEGKDYPIHCRKPNSLEDEEEIMLDVNQMAEGYEYYSVSGLSISADNKMLAYGVDTVSRRVYTIYFKNLETGEILSDQLTNTTGGGAWSNDNATYYYTTSNEITLLSEKIWKHRLGESDDQLMYEEKDPSFYIGVYKSKSDKYIIIYNGSTTTSDYHILDADKPESSFVQFTPRVENHEYSISHYKDKFYVLTNDEATNFRLMEVGVGNTAKSQWKEVIPHQEDVLLSSIEIFKNHLVIEERSQALTHLKVINQSTKEEHYLEFDDPAYVVSSSTNPEFDTDILRYGYASLTTPNTIYDYNMNTRSQELKKQQEVVGGHNPQDYTSERFFVEARDGAKVPVSVVYKKGFEKNGKNPLLLYSYGSYGSSTDPGFSSSRLSLLDRGFAFAIAHIRGGQEMGRQWYEDGKMFKKINTFNDYIDCSKYLIDNQYTSEDNLYAMGGSAGGLLMGAVVNMAPELYNGVIAAVPFVDVVSTMMDESIPLTTNEFDEWGNPKNKDSYEYMLSYSPYDQVKVQAYPNMLVTTGYFDSQVQYWEPAKWVAKLRDVKTEDNILIMDVNMDAGHGGASGRLKRHRETAREYAFFLWLANKI